jgi:hypothetical protein
MDHKQRIILVMGALLAVSMLLGGCGDDGDSDGANGDAPPAATQAAPGSGTVDESVQASRPAEIRDRDAPPAEPREFEAPFSVGTYMRQSVTGQPAAPQMGGQQVVYQSGQVGVLLTAMHFDRTQEAVDSVRFALGSHNIVEYITRPYYDTDQAFGMVRDRTGYLAVWSQGRWFFMARCSDLGDLESFLDAFPY